MTCWNTGLGLTHSDVMGETLKSMETFYEPVQSGVAATGVSLGSLYPDLGGEADRQQ